MYRLALLTLISFLFSSTLAFADPITAILAYEIIGSVTLGAILQVAFIIGSAVYGAAQQRRAAKDAAQKAKDAFNNSLHDRTVTSVTAENPQVYAYGRTRVGSTIVGIFTSGDKDQYKHLVCVHAAHECDAIEEVYVAGKPLGVLDGNGSVTTGYYYSLSTNQQSNETVYLGANTLQHIPVSGLSLVFYSAGGDGGGNTPYYLVQGYDFQLVGQTLTLLDPSGNGYTSVNASYQYSTGTPRVRVSKHLGIASDEADAQLTADVGSNLWPTSSYLRGYCYTVVRIDLNQPDFQSGIPSIEVLVRGKKIYDPRIGYAQWSQNPALCIYDYLQSPLCGIANADIPVSSVITAANVCDTYTSLGYALGGVTNYDNPPLYTINGTVTSALDQANTLEKMAQAMAGSIVATTWVMTAGSYTPPVMSLSQTDIIGNVAISPGISDADLFNGVKGQFVGRMNNYVLTDYPPYQNSTYVAGDGREKWNQIDFPFTDDPARCQQLCRIFTEDQRNSFTMKAEFNLKTWPLQIGDRVTMDSAFFGEVGKIYRVTDKKYSPSSAIELTLKEDAASIWDSTDATTLSSTPASTLPNPYAILPLASLTVDSGTSDLIKLGDGSIVSRIRVTWPAARTQAVFTNGVIELQWMRSGNSIWQTEQTQGSNTQVYLAPVVDGSLYTIRARTVNPYLNVKSDWVYTQHVVLGKSQPPSNVTNLTYSFENFGVRLSWSAITDLDADQYQIRKGGTTWETSTPVSTGRAVTYLDKVAGSGSLNYFVKAIDTTGNYSLAAATLTIAVPTPTISNVASSVSGQDFVLSWQAVAGSFQIDSYEVRYGATYATSTFLDQVKTLGYSKHVDFGGSRTFYISGVDVAGNKGLPASATLTIASPANVVITSQVIDNNVLLNWSDATTTLPIARYEIHKGTSYALGTSIGDNGNGRFAAFFEQLSGVFTYYVLATDTAGNTSVATSITATVNQPPDYVLRLDYQTTFSGVLYDFLPNGALSNFTASGATISSSNGTLTITSTSTNPQLLRQMNDNTLYGCEYQTIKVNLRRISGSGTGARIYYDTASHGFTTGYYKDTSDTLPAIGEEKVITFDMSTLTVGAQDWNASIINDIRFDIGNTTTDVFEIDYIKLVPYQNSNITYDNGNLYVALTQQSWQQHFTSNSWTTPQDQINAGFPYYFESTTTSGYYEEVINYGAVLASTTVTSTISYTTVIGTVSVTPTLSYKLNWADAWTDAPGVTSVVATNFQFVKLRYDFAATGGANMLMITNIDLKISSKAKSDAGNGSALSTDASGTQVNFAATFLNVTSLIITPKGTTAPIIAIYDFVDIPNPTFFKVYLYNTSGARVSGSFSWAAKGV